MGSVGWHMVIRFFDMFSGIGGFRSGLEVVGGFRCIGHCEIDRYVNQAYMAIYQPEGECYYEDATKIDPTELPDFELLCGGFPCQSFSIAGKRAGFADARGTLFFDIARIVAFKRPPYLLLENVPGLLSHDQGRTFATILSALSELGYDVCWQVLNSKDFGVPQSRKRVLIVAYLRECGSGPILSFTESNGKTLVQILPGSEGNRIYSPDGVSITLTSTAGGFGGKTGLYDVKYPTKNKTEDGFCLTYPDDGDTRQGYYFVDLNPEPKLTSEARCITARQDAGVSKHRGERSGVFIEEAPRAVLTPDREKVRQQGRRMKEPNEPMFTITAQDRHGILRHGRVRRLMPIECWRLQGFTDEQFHKAAATGLKDGKLYKLAGNAVTVPVISAIGLVLRTYHAQLCAERRNTNETGEGFER